MAAYILGGVLILIAVALVALVLLQQGKDKNLSGAIAGGADTFFGKSKDANNSKKLSVVTTVIAIVFVLIVLAVYLMQGGGSNNSGLGSDYEDGTAEVTVAVEADK